MSLLDELGPCLTLMVGCAVIDWVFISSPVSLQALDLVFVGFITLAWGIAPAGYCVVSTWKRRRLHAAGTNPTKIIQ